MRISLIESDKVADLQAGISELIDQGAGSILLLACDDNGWSDHDLVPVIEAAGVPVLGGIFPQVIHAAHNYQRGCVLVGFDQKIEYTLIEGLSDPDVNYDIALQALPDSWFEMTENTWMVWVDGLASRIAEMVEALFFNLGLEHNYIGGGAGSLSFIQKPCLITPEGLRQDAALLMRLPVESALGVGHGWVPISEPLKVTESERNRIDTLEWQPAFSVYRPLVEAYSGQVFHNDNFFDIAKAYPLGFSRLDSDLVVRDPLMCQGESMICVGEVVEGSFLRVLHGTSESLIAAAAEVRDAAESTFAIKSSESPHMACLIDCISRVLFLEDAIQEELAVLSRGLPLFGAFTLGEIANNGQEYLEFYNKTAVLGLLSAEKVQPGLEVK